MDRQLPRDEDRLAPHRGLIRSTSPRRAASGDERGRLVAIALVSFTALALLAVWARFLSPAAWEPGLLNALALGPDMFGELVRAINTLGNPPLWAIVVAISALGVALARGARLGAAVLLSFAADAAAFAIKLVVERARPGTTAVEQFYGIDSFAFPSGHVTRAVALACVLAWIVAPPRFRLPIALAAAAGTGLVMGHARVALGVHWPTDALGGMLLGLGWFAVTARLIR